MPYAVCGMECRMIQLDSRNARKEDIKKCGKIGIGIVLEFIHTNSKVLLLLQDGNHPRACPAKTHQR